ncbi:LysR family transcriptional regulator [Actibacterium sp.]|uniref:LysR family transcriptional regulator n=1 Tax=Actibacterium sp. TaxID=1872125 RepID=UPI003566E7AA
MHISRTDLNLFVVFEAIYSQGGVTRAAETLNLTQPTISHALGRLRDRMDDPLFVRHGQKLVPTSAAQKMIGPVRQALQLFERTLGELDGFDPSSADMTFSIGMRPLMEHTFFLPLVTLARETAPKITVTSNRYDRHNLETDLSAGRMNAAIDVFLPLPDSIRRKHLTSSRSVIVARKDHPIAREGLDLEAYLSLEHILVTSRPGGHGPEDVALSREGKSRRVAVRCQQINTAMRLVDRTDLVLTMSEAIAERANIWFKHQIIATPFAAPKIDTYLYWHANSDADQANQWFRGVVEGAVQLPPPDDLMYLP